MMLLIINENSSYFMKIVLRRYFIFPSEMFMHLLKGSGIVVLNYGSKKLNL